MWLTSPPWCFLLLSPKIKTLFSLWICIPTLFSHCTLQPTCPVLHNIITIGCILCSKNTINTLEHGTLWPPNLLQWSTTSRTYFVADSLGHNSNHVFGHILQHTPLDHTLHITVNSLSNELKNITMEKQKVIALTSLLYHNSSQLPWTVGECLLLRCWIRV